ncbi:MAG: GNAT family N-acetyltransferase [Clostridia bacterium]|nr:GNAT family N-acetyltransferase [Clostridia bacterium]
MVSEKPRLAEIYVDDEINPKYCAMLLGHYLFLNGVSEDFAAEFCSTVFNEKKRKDLGVIIVFYSDKNAAEAVGKNLGKVYDNTRSLYRYAGANMNFDEKPLGGIGSATPIGEELLNSDLNNIEMITEEVLGTATYDDMDDFCRNGIGFTFIDENRICAFCTSEYPSANSLAIGIAVDENHRRRGIASAMTNAFLKKAAERKLNVFWECWKNNAPSVQTALKCGFEKVADYPVLFVNMEE